MVAFEKGDYVFLPDDEACFLPAVVTSSFEPGKPGAVALLGDNGEQLRQVRISGKHSQLAEPMDKQSLRSHEDMVVLKQLDNSSLLHNLRLRFGKNDIYTCIGTILVSVNPYKQIEGLYSPEMQDRYMQAGGMAGEMAPHIFRTAEACYTSMAQDDQDQSAVITGESGAGKTEATKLFLAYVAERSRRQRGGRAEMSEEQKSQAQSKHLDVPLREQILGANPLMEAFGNAKTVRNDNSSRFGKLIDVHFLRSLGCVAGGRITNYLLEKSRVVRHQEGERSYHIFYQLCAAATTLDPALQHKFHLMEADLFYFLNQSKKPSTRISGVDDASEWEETLGAMKLLHMDEEQMESVFRVLAGILHLGNVAFQPESSKSDFAQVSTEEPLALAAELFGVETRDLEAGLLTRDISNRTERVIQRHNVREATDSRDALAKHMYSRLFNWLTDCINEALSSRLEGANSNDIRTISVLDIFGFESFALNSFEQLCINYCNEKLQGFFNNHIFKLEQEEYRREEIDVSQIGFSDNQGVIDTIDHRSNGIFAVCDDEVNLLRGTDDGFLNKILESARVMERKAKQASQQQQQQQQQQQAGSPAGSGSGETSEQKSSSEKKRRQSSFAAGMRKMSALVGKSGPSYSGGKVFLKEPDVKTRRNNVLARNAFIVVHFAGDVMYNVAGFLEKNRDILRGDMLKVVATSEVELVRELFDDELDAMAEMAKAGRKNSSRKTLGRKFQEQLDTLMVRLGVTEPHFVRCIKPNGSKAAMRFEAPLVLDQLRYAGLLEVCRIRKLGYPCRKSHDDFLHLFRCLHPEAADLDDLVAKLKAGGLLYGAEWQKGKTKMFMRAAQLDSLLTEREAALYAVTVKAQAQVRRFIHRNRYVRAKTVFKDLEKGIADRDKRLLEASIPFAANLPNAGRNVALIERARRVLAEIKEQEAHLAAMDAALEAKDIDALGSLIATAEGLGLGDSAQVGKARAMLRKHREEKACVEQLSAAIEARDVGELSAALSSASQLGLTGCHEAQTARALLERLEEEERLLSALEAAMTRKDLAEMQVLAQALADLGSGDHPTVLEALKMTKQMLKESRMRAERLDALEKDTVAAMAARDLDLLNGIRVRITELAATGELYDDAMALRLLLESRAGILHRVTVEAGLLVTKSRALDGLVQSDLEPLGDALEDAVEHGFTEQNEPGVKAGREVLARMQLQLDVQQQLEDALDANTHPALLAALLAAQAIGMQTADARKVAQEVRYLEKIRLGLDRIDARAMREKRNALLRVATPDERDELDAQRFAAMNSGDFQELLRRAETPGRYEMGNFYRLRAEEDFTDSFPPSQRSRQAALMLVSTRVPIPKSLHECDEDQNVIAVRMNQAVLQYCGDVGAANTTGLAHYAVMRALEDARLADELLLQLCKAIRANDSPESENNAWLLMCMALRSVGPSDALAPFFLNFLMQYQTRPALIGNYARLCLAQASSSMALGPCRFKPSMDELASYKKRPPVLASITVVDGTVVEVPVSPDQRCDIVARLVREQAGIFDAVSRPAWSIFVKDTDLSASDNLRDRLTGFWRHYNEEKLPHVETYVSYWEGREDELFAKLEDKYGPEPSKLADGAGVGGDSFSAIVGAPPAKNPGLRLPITAARAAGKFMRINNAATHKAGPSPQCAWPLPWWARPGDVYKRMAAQNREPQFTFKRRILPEKGRADVWLYQQLKMDVENDILPVSSEQDVSELAAISMVVEQGDELSLQDEDELLRAGLSRHIPRQWLASKSADFFAHHIVAYVDLGSDGPAALRQRYVDICKRSPAYGMCLFHATRQTNDERAWCIGINPAGVHILTEDKTAVVRTFPLNSIKKFGSSTGVLWLKVKRSLLKQQADPRGMASQFGGAKPKDLQKEATGGAKSWLPFSRNDGFDVVLNSLTSWEAMDLLFDLRKIDTEVTSGSNKAKNKAKNKNKVAKKDMSVLQS